MVARCLLGTISNIILHSLYRNPIKKALVGPCQLLPIPIGSLLQPHTAVFGINQHVSPKGIKSHIPISLPRTPPLAILNLRFQPIDQALVPHFCEILILPQGALRRNGLCQSKWTRLRILWVLYPVTLWQRNSLFLRVGCSIPGFLSMLPDQWHLLIGYFGFYIALLLQEELQGFFAVVTLGVHRTVVLLL